MSKKIALRTNKTILVFAAVGFFVTLAVFWLLSDWVPIFAALYSKPNLGYHELPLYTHYLEGALRSLLWVIFAVLIIIDGRKRNFTRTGGFVAGFLLACLVALIVFSYQYADTMRHF